MGDETVHSPYAVRDVPFQIIVDIPPLIEYHNHMTSNNIEQIVESLLELSIFLAKELDEYKEGNHIHLYELTIKRMESIHAAVQSIVQGNGYYMLYNVYMDDPRYIALKRATRLTFGNHLNTMQP